MVKPNREEQTIPQNEGMEQPETPEMEAFEELTEPEPSGEEVPPVEHGESEEGGVEDE